MFGWGKKIIDNLERSGWVWEHFNENTSEKKFVAMTAIDTDCNYYMLVHPKYCFLELQILEIIEKDVKINKLRGDKKLKIHLKLVF